jgi:hypothetical protein
VAVSSANLCEQSLDGAAVSISLALGKLPFSDSLSRVDKADSYMTIYIVFVVVVQTGSGSLSTAEVEFRSQVNLCRTQLHGNRFCSLYFGCRVSADIRQCSVFISVTWGMRVDPLGAAFLRDVVFSHPEN